jgi:hypothetical protein
MANQVRSGGGLVGGLVLLFIMLMVGWVAFKAVSGIFSILAFVAPVFLIMALVMNHTVVTDYVKKIFKLLREDTPKGLLYTVGTVLGYPVVAAWLAFKAYATRKSIKQRRGNVKKKDYIEYEEVEEVDDEDFLELPDLNKVKQKQTQSRSDNSYDDMFN